MSELLNSADLARLQNDIEAYTLPDTCNILSLSRTSDNQGGWTESWGTATASVKCRLDGLANTVARDSVQGSSLRDYSRWIITLPHDATLQADWRIEHSSGTYAVITLMDNGSWNAHTRATLERL